MSVTKDSTSVPVSRFSLGAKAPSRMRKLADKPGFVLYCYKDSHSSRRAITHTLEQPTHWQRESRLLPVYLVLLQMEVAAFHRN
ncbi:MAG: hypothetical protein ACI8PW_000521 [Methylophilaceae bacterium]|jgi:hypothetical protein